MNLLENVYPQLVNPNTPQGQYVNVNLDLGTWTWLQMSFWVAAILIITVIALVAFMIWREHRTPLESKGIRESSNSRLAGAIIAREDGTADYIVANGSGSQGHLETKPKGKWKFQYRAFYPRAGIVPEEIQVDEANGKDLDQTRAMAEYIINLNSRKLHLRGARTALWIGVESKAILMNIFAIAAIQQNEVVEKLLNAMGEKFPIDLYALKQMVFAGSYNASDINKLANIHEHIGEERAKKPESSTKLVLYAGLAMIVIGAVMLGAAGFI